MTKKITFLITAALMLLTMMATTGTMWGETVKYTITSRNTLTTTGTAPTGSSATIVETYGTSCQMTKGNSQTLTLTNYYGYSISNITLSMKSNQSSGAGKLSYSTDGGTTFTYIVGSSNAGVSFNQAAWNGSWSTSYVDISKDVTIIPESGKNIIIKIEATANSLYCRSYQLTYTSGTTCATPTFTPAAGAVLSGSTVAISTTTDGATIYYTMGANPDDPTTSSDVYSEPIEITEATTIKAMAVKDGYNNSSIASASYTIATPLTTMQEIFDDATANTSAHQVFITFDNWVITGNNGNNPTTAFLSDGTNGCRIYNNGGVGFAKGDILSGTASCNLSLYYGMAQLNLTSAASGLTIQTGGEVTPVVTTIDALTGIKAGSVVTLQGLTYNGSILTDGENSITPYNYMYSASLENDHVYNVTGVFEYGYNSVKRINPRDENDIEEVIITTPTISASNVDIACTATGGEIAYTINNPVDGGSLSATTESDWLILNSNFDSPIAFTCSSNTATEERTATVALTYTYNAKASVTKNVTVTQAAYEAPNVTWDLSTDQTATATTTEMTWTSNYVTMAVAKGSASTNTNNYYPGTSGQNYTSTRFYKNSILTITPVAGYDLSSIEFTATTEGYATTLKNSTWTNATASVSGTIVTVTPTNGTTAISATIGGTCGFTSVKVYYTESSDPAVATTVTIDATGITNTDVYTSTEAGSLSATVHAGETLIDGASVTWESSNSDAATIDENGVVTLVAAGTTTITASYAGVENQYKPSSATYELTVINSNAPGTENNPYTVADAMAAIDAQGTINEAYVTGIVSQVDSYNSSYHSITYWISDDGETTTQLEVYSGKGLNGANFSSVADVQVGATVVVKGKLKLYNQTYEFDYNNELVSYTAPQVTVEAPTFSPAAGTYDEAQSVTLSCTTEGSTIYYTTDGTNPTNESTEYTAAINVENTTTIKAIAYVGNDYSTVATATYTIVTLNNISDITEVGTAYSVKGTVVATNNKGLIIGDGTGYVYYYNNGSVDQSIGDMIKISGNTVTYGQIIQFTSATPNTATITEATTSSYDGTPAAAVITEVPDYSEGYHLSTYLEFTGDLAKSGSNYLITVGEGENNQIQISYPTTAQSEALTALVGMTVRVKGYFSGINSSSKFTVMLESAEEMLVPSITLTPSVINEAPADGGSGEITVTCANMGENPVLSIKFCDANGDPAEYDWISAVFNDTYTKITGTFTENTTTEPRTAHLKVYGTVPNSTTIVYSDIFSITQLAPAGPSIVFETTSMDLEAGGETDRKLSFDYSGLGSTPTFTINYYEQDGETEVTAATYDWLTASIDENDKLNITVGANTGEARSAYLKVYGVKNENVHAESNLVTITQAEYVDPTQDIVDILDLAFTGVTGTGYSDWSNKTGTSGAVYAGNSAGGNSAIQFRTDNSNSGIVTTTSAGKITKVEVTWNSNTADGRTLNIYGSNTAYTAASNLYGDNAGTLIGTIVYGTSTELTISDEYAYIGLRSSNKALYLDEIKITWTTGPAVPSITVTPAEITDVSAAGDIPEHTVILANLNISSTDDFLFAYCDLEGNILGNTDPKPNWIELAEAEYTATGENVYSMVYTVAANEETTPRTGYFKIGIEQATETVYSNIVTVTQLGYVTPVATITVVPNEVLDVPAAGDVYVHTVTLENMTVESTDDFTLAFCDENGEVLDEQAPKPDWIEIGDVEFAVTSEENVYSLTYPVAENTETTPRTAYFKVAATQTSEAVYSNLVTVTQDGYVPPVVTDDYELFSGTLVEGDYIIVYDGSAMNDEVSNDRLQFKSVTSVNNVISTDDATIVWHIAQSGDYWTIYSADANAYAASTGAKNKAQMLADGTDDKALWSVESTSQSETYDFVNKQNTTNNVNAILRNNKDTNNNYGFACYASGTGGALSLYKKVDNSPSITLSSYEIEATAEGGDGTLTVTYKNIETTVGASIYWFESDGETSATEPDWMSAEINETTLNVDYLIGENTGAARNAYFKVCGSDSEANLVYSNLVTISQESGLPVATIILTDSDSPSTPVDPYHIEFPHSAYGGYIDYVEYNNFQSTLVADDFHIEYFDSNGDPLTDNPEWIELLQVYSQEENLRLSISVYANTTSDQRIAYFKVWAMNGEEKVYSDIVTMTQAGDVPPVVTEDYELFSGNLVEGDYIIYYNGYAMKDDVDSNRLKYEEVTPDNDVIETGDATIVWHIAQNGNYWTIYSADAVAYAASTGTKNQATLYQGTPDNYDKALWTVSGTETYEFVNKYNSENNINANLRNNGTYGFACYASSTGGALSLYKKVDNTPSLSFNGPTANIGTYPTGSEIVWDNITVTQHNLTENILLSAKKGTVTPNSIDAGAEPTQVTWSYTPTAAGYTTDTITATSGTLQATLIIQFMAKTPHNIYTSVENGIIVVLDNKTTAIENENVDFTVTPNEGYVIDEITVMAGETPVDFNDYETFYRFQMPDSNVTISATFNALPKYTIKFYVNGEQDEALTIPNIVQGNSTGLPTESAYTPTGFSIAGWAEEGSTIAVADPYTPTDNVDLYALFQLDNAQTTSGNYVKVTEELTDWSGEYLIVYEDGNVAFDGSLTTLDANGNTIAVTLTNNTIEATTTTNASKFTIVTVSGGYSILSASGYFIGQTTNENGLSSSTTEAFVNTISYDTENNCVNVISSGGAYLRYNSDASRFRYYKSSSYTGQKAIQLYKKESTSFNTITILDNTIPEQTISDPIPNATCVVVPNNVTLTYTGPNPSTPEALVVQEGGQLIHESDVEATVQKGISAYSTKSGDGWYLIASPVDNYSTSTIATGTYDLFIYNEPNAYWYSSTGAAAPFNTLERGKGYLYANAANVNLNYAGTMKATDANIEVNLSFACGEYPDLKGFNLVGNPFTRNITAADMVIGEDAVTSYYDFNADRTEFVTYQINERPIQPGQGFFIQATASEQKLVFNPTTPPTKDASDFKYISISAGDENFTDKAYIQFGYGNTLRKMTFGENTMVYVMNDDLDYAAARVEELAGTMPVHFVPIEDGFYTITVETKNIENLNYMHLIDNIKNTEIDLLVEPSYTFKASESDNADRFYLVFDFNNYTGINENYTNDNFAHQIGDEIFVSDEGTLQVFDVLGRFVTGYNVNGDKRISTAEFNTGVYIFRMVGTEVKTQKIIVR